MNNPLRFNGFEDLIRKQEGKIKELFDKEAIRFEELTESKAACDDFGLTMIAFYFVKTHNDEILHGTRQISMKV